MGTGESKGIRGWCHSGSGAALPVIPRSEAVLRSGATKEESCIEEPEIPRFARDDRGKDARDDRGKDARDDRGLACQPSRIGSRYTLFPAAADTALTIAPIAGGTAISPMPVGGSALSTTCASTTGASRIRTSG